MVMNVLLVGAHGFVGSKVLEELVCCGEQRFKISVLLQKKCIEDTEVVNFYKNKNVRIVEGDCSLPETLTNIWDGIDVCISMLGNTSLIHEPNLVKSCKGKNLKRFIPSQFGIDILELKDVGELECKMESFRLLQEYEIPYTLIFNGLFYEMLFDKKFGFDLHEKKFHFIGDGKIEMSVTHREDLAKMIPLILDEPTSRNQCVHVQSDCVTQVDVSRLYTEITGIKLEEIVEDENCILKLKDSLPDKIKPYAWIRYNILKYPSCINFGSGEGRLWKLDEVKRTPLRDFVKTCCLGKTEEEDKQKPTTTTTATEAQFKKQTPQRSKETTVS